MTRNTILGRITWVALVAGGLVLGALSTGCDIYDGGSTWGGLGSSYVEPMDFSPYGYDYSMYDLFTEDI